MNSKICGIYKITSPSGKIYIGQTVDWKKRFAHYKCLSCKHQKKLYNSFLKHGVENHIFEIIISGDFKKEELCELEIKYIKEYNTFNTENGLNLCPGGFSNKGYICPPERIKAISGKNSHKYGKKFSEATKQKMRDARKLLNFSHSQETRKKISEAHKNKKFSAEHKQKLSLNNINSKSVINNITKKTFLSAKQAYDSETFDFTYGHFVNMLGGSAKNKTNYNYEI